MLTSVNLLASLGAKVRECHDDDIRAVYTCLDHRGASKNSVQGLGEIEAEPIVGSRASLNAPDHNTSQWTDNNSKFVS